MGYGKWFTVDIYTVGGQRAGRLFDSSVWQQGAADQIEVTQERSGWKELTFRLFRKMNGTANWRTDQILNDYLVRTEEDGEIDWFIISNPEDENNNCGDGAIYVTCPHISTRLRKRNLHIAFDDTNGIGTVRELVERALDGTEWTIGECDPNLEADGMTVKIRSYSCTENKGAYAMVSEICEKFGCYPVYHGDGFTVDLRAKSKKNGMLELRTDKNLHSIRQVRNSDEIITRLYVHGQYDEAGYVGIEEVNPTGLPFLMNFDYYREIGAFTEAHAKALTDYLAEMTDIKQASNAASKTLQEAMTELATMWGTGGYVLYMAIDGGYAAPIFGGGADQDDVFQAGDDVAQIYADGSYEYKQLTALTPGGEAYAVKFLKPVTGTLGGREVAIEAKKTTIDTLQEAFTKADSNTEKESLQAQIANSIAEIARLQRLAYEAMLISVELARLIAVAESIMSENAQRMANAEQIFTLTLGNMLQDGYFTDDTYAPGQEAALLADAEETLQRLSKPQYSFTISEADLSGVPGYEDEVFQVNTAAHIVCEAADINAYGYADTVTDRKDKPGQRRITIATDEVGTGSSKMTSFMSRIADMAQLLKDERAIYQRAEALSPTGMTNTGKLDGLIDVLHNHLRSNVSNWYTDEHGHLVFVSLDESSAMMLCGSGFMIANGKNDDGSWNWRTFGTGQGFTADLITTGILRAGLITILGSDQFMWNGENIYVIDADDKDRQIRIGRYDGEHLGIGYTQDGGKTWQTAIGFDGIHLAAADRIVLESLQTQIEQTSDEVTILAGKQIGGTNLIRNGGFYNNLDKWTTYSYGSTGTGHAVVVHTVDRDVPSAWLSADHETGIYGITQTIKGLRKHTQYVLQWYAAGKNCETVTAEIRDAYNGAWIVSEKKTITATGEDNLSLYDRFTVLFNTGNSTDINFLLYSNTFGADACLYIAQAKLEEGNTATAWSAHPDDPVSSLTAGSSVVINEDGVRIAAKILDVEAYREDGSTASMRFTADALAVDKIESPSVAPRYMGPAHIYADPAATSAQIAAGTHFRTLSDALQTVNNRQLGYEVTIHMAGGMTEYGQLMIVGLCGEALFITSDSANHAKLNGAMRIRRCSAEVEITYLDVIVPSNLPLSALIVRSCSYVRIADCTVTSFQSAFHISRGANVMAENNTLFVEGNTAGHVFYGGRVHYQNNIGSGVLVCDAGIMTIAGKVPAGGVSYLNTFEPNNINAVTPTSADGAPVAPVITTAEYPMMHADSYAAGNVDSWAYPQSKPSDDLYQGYTGQAGRICGCIWFDNEAIRAALTGRTVNQASIRLTAQKYVGRGAAVTVCLRGTATEYAGRSSHPALTTDYGAIGTAEPGMTVTLTIPNQAVTDLVNGTINGLVLYSEDTKDMEGRNYSQNYMRFDGGTSGTQETRPNLTIVYEE